MMTSFIQKLILVFVMLEFRSMQLISCFRNSGMERNRQRGSMKLFGQVLKDAPAHWLGFDLKDNNSSLRANNPR
jgi:hypothetical protein